MDINGFEDALERDEISLKKEMGVEGLKEIRKVERDYENDPYQLNVKVQDMSDTLIYRAFGRIRDNSTKGVQ